MTPATPAPTANDYDEDGNALSLVVVTGPAHGTLSVDLSGRITYTPNESFFGVDSFTYRSDDGMLLSDNIATVTITVQAVGGTGGGLGGGGLGGGGLGGGGWGSGGSAGSGDGDSGDGGGGNGDQNPGSDSGTSGTDGRAPGSGLVGDPDTTGHHQTGDDQATANRKHAQQARDEAARSSDDELDAFDEISSTRSGRSMLWTMRSKQDDALVAASMFQKGLSDALLEIDQDMLMSWYLGTNITGHLLEDTGEHDYLIGTTGTTLGIASIGYVLWALRGGMFIATMYAGIPGWRMLDLTALLNAYRADDAPKDRVEEMLDRDER